MNSQVALGKESMNLLICHLLKTCAFHTWSHCEHLEHILKRAAKDATSTWPDPLKELFAQKWQFCHHLLTLKLFQTRMSFFLPLSTKENILKNVGNQIVDGRLP